MQNNQTTPAERAVQAGHRAKSSNYIRAKIRKPITRAAISVASVMLGGAAAAQEASNEPGNEAGQVTLEQIDIDSGAGSPYNPIQSLQLDRIPTPILDTPQSITVIPQQLIQDQRINTLQEALRNVPGITFQAAEGGVQGDNFSIRGFTARNDIYRDGVREPGWYTRDVFSVENVEVLKGPSSFLFGRGSTGGVVNITTKLPKFANFTEIEMSGGTAPSARVVVDVNRQFGNAAGRIVLLGTDANVAGRDFINVKRFGVAPSFTMQFNEQTKGTISYIYQKDDNIPDYGIPLFPGSWFGTTFNQPVAVYRDKFYGAVTNGNSDTEQVNAHIVTAKVDHYFTKDWHLTEALRFSDVNRFLRVRATSFATTANLFNQAIGGTAYTDATLNGAPLSAVWLNNPSRFYNFTHNQLYESLTNLTGEFDTGSLHHTLLAGLEISFENRNNYRVTFVQPKDRVNAANPDAYPALPGAWPDFYTATNALSRTVGLYAGDQIKLNEYLEILGGFRYDNYKTWQYQAQVFNDGTVTQNGTTPFNLTNTINFVSWRAGAVGHPTDYSSLYFMYGTSFNPPSEFTTIPNGQQDLAPTTNETYEFGGKVNLFDDRLSLNAAIFQTTQQNAVEQIDIGPPPVFQLVGTTRVKGAEIGAAGQVTKQWSIFGGYTYLNGRLINSIADAAYIGNQIANAPFHSFSMTNTYKLTPDFEIGASVFYVGPRWSNVEHTGRVPGFVTVDAFANYRIDKNVQLQANIYNIGNVRNFESVGNRPVPGPGRYALFTARINF
jgi:catecholate siderophore receptor